MIRWVGTVNIVIHFLIMEDGNISFVQDPVYATASLHTVFQAERIV